MASMVLTFSPSTEIGKPTKLEYLRMFFSIEKRDAKSFADGLSLSTIFVPGGTLLASESSYEPSPVDFQQCATDSSWRREKTVTSSATMKTA